jgi:hypothetical protein
MQLGDMLIFYILLFGVVAISNSQSEAAACQGLHGASSDSLQQHTLLVQGYHW